MLVCVGCFFFFVSSRRRHTRYWRDWSSDVCSSDLSSTAGKVRLGGITRAGDEGLRSVLVVGATTVIQHAQRGGRPSPWLTQLLKRKSPKLAAVALANKMARIAWKLMVTGENYATTAAPAALAGAA